LVGNLRLVREHGVAITAEIEEALAALDGSGQTPLLVVRDGQAVGVLGARDRVRPEAHDVIHELKHLGFKELAILTGDRAAAARAVGKKVHIKDVEAELTPAAKADWIEQKQRDRRIVAMVGDGINDAPALARADVGLALAGVGSDLAAEAGSVILLGDPLAALPESIRLARQTIRVIRQNIVLFAFGFNGIAVALAGLSVLGPVGAAIVHQAGSLLVLCSAIRILGFERWHTWKAVRGGVQLIAVCRRCRPGWVIDWAWRRRSALLRVMALFATLAYLGSGVTIVGPDQLGVLRRFGRYRSPVLRPGLHVRFPPPFETVIAVEPDRSRVVRVGLAALPSGTVKPVAWSTAHTARRDESALFFTGDENLVELAAVVEYHFTESGLPALLFGVANIDETVSAAAEGIFREAAARRTFESILVSGRCDFEADVARRLQERLRGSGVRVSVDRVRLVDAHPPREVVPAYRDVSAAVSDFTRSLNQAQGMAAERHCAALAEAQAIRDTAQTRSGRLVSRARGERGAFLAQATAHALHPRLTEFRLLWDTLGTALPGRSKLILDRRAAGRRHVWLADSEQFAPSLGRALAPLAAEPRAAEPND
jgi:Cu+-exporting ATPase